MEIPFPPSEATIMRHGKARFKFVLFRAFCRDIPLNHKERVFHHIVGVPIENQKC